ncbi:hypothetical protein K9N08_02010 [Candidatus Gracilibacteria bacterium]|nr:hypothetical protein [Candidatus Gracilibacteria bacterium]MCF7856313.1 hypothetical protein [Candidatus Gracilibacteria bacterium]MCF7896668.1 hypothetical protein [Candidatus Gracilibacteria bacterium]
MKTKFSKIVAVTIFVALLAACGPKSEVKKTSPITPVGGVEIQNMEAVAPLSEIQTVGGTSAEKVEIYTDKAREAQTKLQLLLESDLLKVPETNPETSFFDRIIPTAFAEDSTEDQIAQLLAEIQTYTELAAEAATESTNPEEISELLSAVQETQTGTIEILDEASDEAIAVAGEAIETTVAETMASIAEVDFASAEVADAIDSGATEVSVDVETDVEDFIETGATTINLQDKINPRQRAERKVQRALRELEKVKTKLIENEVPQEEADAILAELKSQVETAREFTANGDFQQAVQLAQNGKREINKVKNVVARAKDAKGRVADLKVLAEGGDAVAAEQLEKLQPLLEKGKEFKQMLDERKEEHQEFIEAAKEGRKELKKVRRGENADLLELKKLQAMGEISEEDFIAKKEAILENAKTVRESNNQAQKELREEKIDWLQELNGLPPAEIQAKKREFEKEIENRKEEIRTDQKRLYDAVQSGNVETIQIVKDGIQSKQQQVRAEQKEKVQQFVEQKMEAMPTENREMIQNKREDLRFIRGNSQEPKTEVHAVLREDCAQVGEKVFDMTSKGATFCCEGSVLEKCEGTCTPSILGVCRGLDVSCEVCVGGIDTGKVDQNGCSVYICKDEEIFCEMCKGGTRTGRFYDSGCPIYICPTNSPEPETASCEVCVGGIDTGKVDSSGCSIYICPTKLGTSGGSNQLPQSTNDPLKNLFQDSGNQKPPLR